METPKNVWIVEFIYLRFESYSFKCGNDNRNKLKGFSKFQSKNSKFGEYCNSLFGGDYQKKNVMFFIFCSVNHDMCLQKVRKNTQSAFDEKRCHINEINVHLENEILSGLRCIIG